MSKKRKSVYVDRSQVMYDRNKMPNIMESIKAVACESGKHCSLEKRFKYKLVVDGDESVLDAMVMHNDICILMSKCPRKCSNVAFHESISTEEISGRQKKGAVTIRFGSVICSIIDDSGNTIELKTPVGGKLLEFNDGLVQCPQLLETHYNSSGYIAIIYPNTEIPSLDGCSDYESLKQKVIDKLAQSRDNRCHAFAAGNCSRGDACKFKHVS